MHKQHWLSTHDHAHSKTGTHSSCDTLAWATGTRVGASDHAIVLLVLDMVVSLGFCTVKHLHYIMWFNCAHYCMFVSVVIMWRTL